MAEETLFIVRSCRSGQISVDDFREKSDEILGDMLGILLNGYLNVGPRPYHANVRNYFGSIENPYQRGSNSFNVFVALTYSSRASLRGFRLRNVGGGRVHQIRIPLDRVEMTVYGGLVVPPRKGKLLLPYTWIFGGRIDESPILRELYGGEEIKKMIGHLPGVLYTPSED